jgi:hypothetical protein
LSCLLRAARNALFRSVALPEYPRSWDAIVGPLGHIVHCTVTRNGSVFTHRVKGASVIWWQAMPSWEQATANAAAVEALPAPQRELVKSLIGAEVELTEELLGDPEPGYGAKVSP